MDIGCKKDRKTNPKETANIFSVLSFFYTIGLFRKGYKKDLEEDDLYEVIKTCRSQKLGNQIEKQWEIEEKTSNTPSLLKVLWRCFGKAYMIYGLALLVMNSIMVILIPEAMGKLVSYFSPGQTKLTLNDAYYYASIVIGFHLIHCIFIQNYNLAMVELGIRIRTAVSLLIYRKSMNLNATSLSELTTGRIVTLITKDIDAFEMFLYFGNDIWIGFVQAALICYLIYMKIGVAAFCGVGLVFLFLVIQIIFGKLSAKYRLGTCQKTDERLQMTQETLSAIKTIKMYTWERFFYKNVSKCRRRELTALHKLFYMKVGIFITGHLADKIAIYALLMSYIWLGNNITAEIVYFIMSCFHKLTHLVSFTIPFGISQTAELYATFLRIRTLFETKEIIKPIENNNPTILPKIILDKVAVNIQGIDVIKNTSMTIEKGLNIVMGHVGSGKTILLKTILHDHPIEGHLWVYGRVSYASQEPWLFPSSIRQNILFGEKFNEKRYQKILDLCDLSYDLKELSDGDQTIVGDRGLNLSKGQQARINLARALYKDSDVYLLDDCLAALDHSVSDYIFNNCIKSFLRDKLCVFVTHNAEHIRQADNIIIISQGSIKSCIKPEHISTEINESIYENNDKEITCEKLAGNGGKVTENIYHENKKIGKIDFQVYKSYVLFGGGYVLCTVVVVLFIVAQSTISYSHKLVSNWVTLEQNISDFKVKNLTETAEFYEISDKSSNTLILYSSIIVISTALALIRAFAFFNFFRRASINIHKAMITKIMNATMLFFDHYFIGNILNRFSKDLFAIDEYLPFSAFECFDVMFNLVGIIFLIATVNTLFLIPATIFLTIAFLMRSIYRPTGRSLFRLSTATRSPVIGQINATLEGLTTIRAYKAQKLLINEFERNFDVYTSASYMWECTLRALSFFLDITCTLLIAIVVLRFLVVEIDTSVGDVGLAISQAFHLTALIHYGIRIISLCENLMTAVERALEYTQLEQEPDKGEVAKDWPTKGEIRYENVSLSYNDKSEPVLKDISFTISPEEKVGIVGRTGAGKSSIISTLFRLYEPKGKILIDNINIQDLSLSCLRSNIAIIPQDPVLFSGTIRENIDPFNKLSDKEIWRIIEIVKLKEIIQSLDEVVSNNRVNFSAGQKQLICLGRAIARKNKIVILDEATANMDHETDSIILQTIKENFSTCTVITIAHRLTSVLSSNKIMVINKGELVEFDEPKKLLDNEKSIFCKMIKNS